MEDGGGLHRLGAGMVGYTMHFHKLLMRVSVILPLAGVISVTAWAQNKASPGKAMQCASAPAEAKAPAALKIKSLAKAKNLDKIKPVDESNGACLAGAINRGIRMLVGEVKGMTDTELQDHLIEQLTSHPKTQCNALRSTDPVPAGDTRKRGCDGNVNDFKDAKDKIVKGLRAKGAIAEDIETTAEAFTSGMKPSDFLRKAAEALNAGAVVEMQVRFSDKGVDHIAIAGEIVQYGNDYGVALYDDTTQGDGTASAALRGTYFFPDTGGCYFWSQVDGQKKTVPRSLLGMLIQKKKKPGAAK